MDNTINWGKIYCSTEWGLKYWSTFAVPDISAPACWSGTTPFTADLTRYTVDTTIFTADKTQL